MKYNLKVLKVAEIYNDEELYPRFGIDYETYSKYLDAIKSGAKFPPIKVALKKKGNNKLYVMIDGGHRIKALIDLGQKYVSAEVYEGLTDRQIYQMSVEANASHGKPFENAELRNIVRKLDKEFRMSREDISKIVRIPIDKIDGFIVKEIIRDNPMEPSLARQPAYQHAGINIDVQKVRKVDDNNYKPKRFENDYVRNQQEETKAQLRIIESLIALLKTNAISKRDETINFQLQKLYELLTKRFENEAK